jgi:hypothetical protein
MIMTERTIMMRCTGNNLYTVHGPHGTYWEDVSPRFKAADLVQLASGLGMSYEELGRVTTVLASRNPQQTAAQVNIEMLDDRGAA